MAIVKTCRAPSSAKSASRWATGPSNALGRKCTYIGPAERKLQRTRNSTLKKCSKQVQISGPCTTVTIRDQRLTGRKDGVPNPPPLAAHLTRATTKARNCRLSWRSYSTSTRRSKPAKKTQEIRLRLRAQAVAVAGPVGDGPHLPQAMRAKARASVLHPIHLYRNHCNQGVANKFAIDVQGLAQSQTPLRLVQKVEISHHHSSAWSKSVGEGEAIRHLLPMTQGGIGTGEAKLPNNRATITEIEVALPQTGDLMTIGARNECINDIVILISIEHNLLNF